MDLTKVNILASKHLRQLLVLKAGNLFWDE